MSNIQDAIVLSVTSMKKYTDKKHGGGVKTYETLQVLKEDLNIKIGDKCHSLGYYSMGDGGNSLYKIRAKSDSDVDDGGSIIFLNNGLVATLIVENNTINVKQFGAKGDATTDDTVAIQSAIDASKDWSTIYVPAGIYIISAGLTMEKRRTLRGDSYCRDDCSPFGASVIRVKKGVSNITAFKIVQRRGTETTNPGWNENRSSVINMTFDGQSAWTQHIEGTEVGDKYKLVISSENVNGIDMNGSSHLCNMENVSVNNFSGTGIILGGCSVNRHLCAFGCNVGIDVSTDSLASQIYVWGCNYGIKPSIGCHVESGRVEEICKHAIVIDRVVRGAQIKNLTLDQIGYSAIEVSDTGVLVGCTIDVKMSRCCQYYYGLNCEDLLELSEDERILAAFGEFYVSPKGQLSNGCSINAFCDNTKISLDDKTRDNYSKFFIVNESTSWWGDTTTGGPIFKSNHFKLNEIFNGETYVGADMFQVLLDNHYFYTTTDNNKFGVFTLQNDFEQCMVYGNPWNSTASKVIRYYTFNKVDIS